MHVSIVNFSGNVGKSTIANHVFAPRMPDAPIIRIESVNSDGSDGATIRGDQFREIQEGVLTLTDSISDVGASNVEDYVSGLRSFHGAHEDLDFFIVPTVPDDKQMVDTIATIDALSTEIGVPAQKIRVVFNRVNQRHSVESQFAPIFNWHKKARACVVDPAAAIYSNEIYSLLRGTDQSIVALAADETDYRAMIAGADAAERQRLARMISRKRLAASVKDEHDRVFAILTR
ncbi:StbB family protein [Paraburkholderia flagellata]|uniref:StbB family protein n=1 Tax=Paraburkholderia flagellata TaxID=2883241 RepID=UPI001F386F36|nr:StbB family protein [Paraburkholderia flagellata]